MKTALLALVCVVTFSAGAQAMQIGTESGSAASIAERLAPEEVETLVAPIALYPDPLLAVILPASTRPSDIVLAMRYLESGGDPHAVDQQPWDDSVKALVRYREVLEYLDENLEWTRSLGETFLDQRDEVMAAIQTLRSRAHSQGMLSSSTQQEVIVESEEIRIVPAQPTVIYVPRYDPEVLYVRHISPYPFSYWHRPFITFGIGYSVGSWLSYDCDWRYRSVYVVHRPAYWYHRPDWRVRYVHRDRYPDHRWTHWSPRHDGRSHHRVHRPASQMVLQPNRDWENVRRSRLAANPVQATYPSAAPIEPRWQGDRPERSPQHWSHDARGSRPPSRQHFDGRRERTSDVVRSSGPSVVAVAPNVPTAPSVVTTPPLQNSAPVAAPPPHMRHEQPRQRPSGSEWRDRRAHPPGPTGEVQRSVPPPRPAPEARPPSRQESEPAPAPNRRDPSERGSSRQRHAH